MPENTTNVLHPTKSTFEAEVVASDTPVLIDFWAPWCPPCRMLKPEVEKLAASMQGKARFAFVNVDDEPELASMFQVQSIPALFIVHQGKVVDAFVGYVPQAQLRERLEAAAGV